MAIIEGSLGSVFSSLSEEAAEIAKRVREGVAAVQAEGGGSGSGIVWKGDGIVLTNHHVVSANYAQISLPDGRSFRGTVFRRDPARDLAAIRIAGQDLPAVPVRDSRTLRPGELILAVGNPLGVKGAVAMGIVAGAPGEISLGNRRLPEMVQADVDLYPGNSGGPLVDARGYVVGINSMVTGPGMALAVPSHVAQRFLTMEANRGAYLGIAVHSVEIPPALLLGSGLSISRGLLVHDVANGSPADQAGLLPGDVILAVEGRWVMTGEELSRRLEDANVGQQLRLAVLRGGHPIQVAVVPEARPAEEDMEKAA